MALLRGSYSAWQEYSSNGDAAEALETGFKATAEATIWSFVNIVEFVGRGIHAAATSAPVKAGVRKLREAFTAANQARESVPNSIPSPPT